MDGATTQPGAPQAQTMVGFGGKQAWLAMRDSDAAAVVGALGLRDLGPVPWRHGVDLAYLTDDRLVITPPLPGARGGQWTLAVGRWLFRAAVDVVKLSAALDTDVQLFSSHRVTESHGWRRAVRGVEVRAFAYRGQTAEILDWRGDPDAAETAVGLPPTPDEETDILLGQDDVMLLAAAWSVDPTSLDGRPAPGPLRAAAVD